MLLSKLSAKKKRILKIEQSAKKLLVVKSCFLANIAAEEN